MNLCIWPKVIQNDNRQRFNINPWLQQNLEKIWLWWLSIAFRSELGNIHNYARATHHEACQWSNWIPHFLSRTPGWSSQGSTGSASLRFYLKCLIWANQCSWAVLFALPRSILCASILPQMNPSSTLLLLNWSNGSKSTSKGWFFLKTIPANIVF